MEIYGKIGCSNCEKLKLICDIKNKTYIYKTLGVDFERKDVEWFLKDIENPHFPIIKMERGFFISYHSFKRIYAKQYFDDLK